MQNPSFWARLGLLWCLFVFAACWCASAQADPTGVSAASADVAAAAVAAPLGVVATAIGVANSHSGSKQIASAPGVAAHAVPTLDGFGLLILATLLGLAALWYWRRRQ